MINNGGFTEFTTSVFFYTDLCINGHIFNKANYDNIPISYLTNLTRDPKTQLDSLQSQITVNENGLNDIVAL